MNALKRAIAIFVTSAMLAACASGGGGGGGSSQAEPVPPIVCLLVFIFCLFTEGDSVAAPGRTSPGAAATFTTWTDLKRDAPTEAPGVGLRTTYLVGRDGTIRAIDEPTPAGGAVFQYDANGKLTGFGNGTTWLTGANSGTLAALGQPGIDRLQEAVVANPFALGWNYQSFGVWNERPAAGSGAISASSFGQPTPGSAVPTSGSATFTGKAGGFYVSPTGQGSVAAADLTVNANFNARTLGFATSGTTIARDLNAPLAAPHLNLTGTLAYNPGSSAFSGTVSNAGGTMSGRSNGQFYGPAAQELGGVFSLKSSTTVETLTGAYGAKR